jgi:predicted nucleotide-binding protein
LAEQLEKGEKLLRAGPPDREALSEWTSEAQLWVDKAFGPNTTESIDFANAGAGVVVLAMGATEADFAENRLSELRGKVTKLRAFVNYFAKTCEMAGKSNQPSSETLGVQTNTSWNKVFLVHGHDEAAKQAVARLLEKLKLVPVILHEQPDEGRTVIEKFVAHSAVPYAIVLLTPDDCGGSNNAPREDYKPRARQNVILELGFFLGKLGREHVCALHKAGTEIPSDFSGVLYVPMDESGGWHLRLARELRTTFPNVNLNDLG